MSDTDNSGDWIILVNDDEQYSLWPARRQVPPGWSVTGPCGNKEECVEYVDRIWTNMTPASLRGTSGAGF